MLETAIIEATTENENKTIQRYANFGWTFVNSQTVAQNEVDARSMRYVKITFQRETDLVSPAANAVYQKFKAMEQERMELEIKDRKAAVPTVGLTFLAAGAGIVLGALIGYLWLGLLGAFLGAGGFGAILAIISYFVAFYGRKNAVQSANKQRYAEMETEAQRLEQEYAAAR